MRNRRFLLLAAALVTLNASLWIVPQGLALRQVVVATLFGKNLMRADVTELSGAEWRIDRGVVVSNVPGTLTIQEADGRVQPIATSSSTKVAKVVKLKGIKPGWRVLVTWPAPSGPADLVTVEKRAVG